jgi:3-oxoacyl-[acyl-carrier-protein] synthase II
MEVKLKRVVVTGLGAVTPIGNTVEEFWSNLIAGKSGGAPITLFDTTHFKTKFACEVKDFDFAGFFDRKEIRKLDRFTQFAMIVAEEAIKNSGLNLDTENPDRLGVIWGSGIGGLITFHQEVTKFVEGNYEPRYNPFFIPKMISDIASGHISIKYGLRGPNYNTVSACATSTHAMIDAFNLIRLGKADVMVTGGSEATIAESGIGGFNAMQALSKRNDSPETASRPFDATRDGFVMGEGGGCLILEEYEHAKARGAKIYAEVMGGGMSADAHHITAPHPDGIGATNVMLNAMDDFNDITPKDIDYVNVHGTSTPLGDVAELKAITNVFGDHAYNLNISSTKSATGHLLGAAGAVESIASILAINNNIIPPTINHTEADPNIDPKFNLTLNKAQERDVKVALSNTFGFGGHNASVIFRELDA